jgi:biopolymer transport protein ExbD
MKIGSPLPHRRARIEIIPLIDIMFFLLAAFMLASMSMIRLQSARKMDLPTAAMAKRDFTPDIVNISVTQDGKIDVEKQEMALPELYSYLSNKFVLNTNVPVFISGDKGTRHGNIVKVLDTVRRAGIQKVSFTISAEAPPPK